MKADVFKKIIKEAVREAVREELRDMLTETKTVNIKTPPSPAPTKFKPTGDPIKDLLQETRASLTSEDYKSMMNFNSSMVSQEVNPLQSAPEPGIDLSTLDFVKNAGAIYKASIEKDKMRFGG